MPWLLWNYDKQDYANRELVVVDSSHRELDLPERSDVRVVRCPPGTSVPAKRNMALERARGDVITWFDDDDWQHPRKLSLLLGGLRHANLVGNAGAWFVDLRKERALRHAWARGLLFNSLGVRRGLADGLRFDERRTRASDTPWVVALRRLAGSRVAELEEPLFFWLCHEQNLSNPSQRRSFTEPLQVVERAVGAADWANTQSELRSLRERLSDPPASRHHAMQREHSGRNRMKLCVVITTYNRRDQLDRLLDDIEREWRGDGLDVRVYDDASTDRYDAIEERLRRRGWGYLRAGHNHGKKRWWQWWNTILADLKSTAADLYVVIQDDMRLCEKFFDRSRALWAGIPDPRKASLFLHLDEQSVVRGRSGWTPARDVRMGDVVRCGWVDMNAFLCERRLFEGLDWRLEPIPGRRWADDPLLGSGVGPQVSARLYRRGLPMYRVRESLTVHDRSLSEMNPEARRLWPMRTVRFVDGEAAAARLSNARPSVFVSMASVPGRERGLGKVVERILPQVDRLGVFLNGYPRVPRFLDDPRIQVATSQESGDRGDAGKFFWADRAFGYLAFCDDDLRYPADYIERLVAGIDRYGRRAVVGFHGSVLDHEIRDYYRSRALFHFTRALEADTPVHVLGTGAVGYHVSTIAVGAGDLPASGMADIFLALLGQRRRVPFVCLAHEQGWLTEQSGLQTESIYARATNARAGVPSEQTRLVRQQKRWRLFDVRPTPPTQGDANRYLPNPSEPRRVSPHLGRLVRVSINGPSGNANLLLPEGDHITAAIQRSGTYYERDLLDAIRRLAPSGTFVDVGAHYGNHTIFFALECGAERVVAIEPNPPSFNGLLANIQANGVSGRVTPLPIAIHPTSDRVDLESLPWQARRGIDVRTNSGMVAVVPSRGGGIAAARLDDALAPFQSIGVLKVDAEGLGLDIVESGMLVLERDHPIVAVELTSPAKRTRLQELLRPLGYVLTGQFCWTPTWLWVPRAYQQAPLGQPMQGHLSSGYEATGDANARVPAGSGAS